MMKLKQTHIREYLAKKKRSKEALRLIKSQSKLPEHIISDNWENLEFWDNRLIGYTNEIIK